MHKHLHAMCGEEQPTLNTLLYIRVRFHHLLSLSQGLPGKDGPPGRQGPPGPIVSHEAFICYVFEFVKGDKVKLMIHSLDPGSVDM